MIDPDIAWRINQQEELQGIDIKKVKPNTKIIVTTQNSIYTIIIIDQEQNITISGGTYFVGRNKAVLNGSTWGGSILKIGWIGYGMSMEILSGDKVITTSGVKAAKVIGDNYEYDMEWPVE